MNNIGSQEASRETTNVLYVGSRDHVLLQTAQVYIRNGNSMEKIQARLIFDSGSQISFINEDVASNLNLPVISQDSLNVLAFGNIFFTSYIEFKLNYNYSDKI